MHQTVFNVIYSSNYLKFAKRAWSLPIILRYIEILRIFLTQKLINYYQFAGTHLIANTMLFHKL